MPVVRVEMWKGVPKAAKREIAMDIAESLERRAGKAKEYTSVLFVDYEQDNWALGGVLCSDIDWDEE